MNPWRTLMAALKPGASALRLIDQPARASVRLAPRRVLQPAWLFVLVVMELAPAAAAALDPELERAEAQRVAVVERLSQATVAIFEKTATNGGSGVIVREDGLVVTNFHVTAPCGPQMLVGTNDGRVHEAVLVGIDPTGDIALVQLQGPGPFHAAPLGNRDLVRVGDEAIVAGNPFLLAEDFTPSVSIGVISGVHRYQYPSGSLLEYADCLQTDAAINPGNSGGPLFDNAGRLIGINGRGSFEKRGRVNVGVGYAVSVNQVLRFLSHLETGRIVDHATLGATVATRRGPLAQVTSIETTSDAYRRGLRPGDEVVSLDGRDTPTANALLNAVGVLPAGWRASLEYRRDGRLYRTSVRLGALHAPGELEEAVEQEQEAEETDEKAKADAPKEAAPFAVDLYEERSGYANYAMTRAATRALLKRCLATDTPPPVLQQTYRDETKVRVTDKGVEWRSPQGEYDCDATRELARQATPPDAPPLLAGLWVWSRLATGEEGLLDEVEALGRVPWDAGEAPHDVLVALHRGVRVEVFLDPTSGEPVGFEAARDAAEDAVRVEFDEWHSTSGWLPAAFTVRLGDRKIGAWVAEEETP